MRYDPPFVRGHGLLPALVALALLAAFPVFFDSAYARHVMILAFVFAAVACSWDLSLGFGGLFNFAHVALFAVGIYAYGILAKTLGVSPWLAVPAGGAAAALLAALIALPVRRLDGIYVILVTIAFSQLLYQFVVSQPGLTGGTSGMVSLPSLSIAGHRLTSGDRIGYYFAALGLMAASLLCLQGIVRSRFGRAVVALRDNKYYAVARGVGEGRVRLQLLAVSAFFSGTAGGFYASYVRVASPDIFGIGSLTLLLSILLVGGASTLWGPAAAAFVIVLLSELAAEWGPWREIAVAALIIAVMVFYPGGLWGAVQEARDALDARFAGLRAWHRRRRQRAAREARLGAREKILETRHGRIAVADSGPPDGLAPGEAPGAPLLFIHGNSACKEAFLRQFAAFRGRHRLLAFDLPGHGASSNADPEKSYNIPAYAEVAEEVLADAGVEGAVVLGWSLGGYVALELAARGKAGLAGLAIAGTSPLNVAPEDFAAGYDASSHLVLAGKRFFTRRERRAFAGSATAPLSAESRFLHRNISRTDGRARFYMITKLQVVDWPRQMRMLREGRLPFAILNGADDPFLNHAYIAALPFGRIWSGAPHDIPEGRHAPFFNRPEAFNRAFAAFVEEAAAGGAGSAGERGGAES